MQEEGTKAQNSTFTDEDDLENEQIDQTLNTHTEESLPAKLNESIAVATSGPKWSDRQCQFEEKQQNGSTDLRKEIDFMSWKSCLQAKYLFGRRSN
jgi:hypothetical protein